MPGPPIVFCRWPISLRGGTLVEVLVSLVIITLVAGSVLEVASHRRQAAAYSQRSQRAFELAMLWQSGRRHNERWARSSAGGFPDDDHSRWVLLPLPSVEPDGRFAPDPLWRHLQVIHLDHGTEEVTNFTFRLDNSMLGDER